MSSDDEYKPIKLTRALEEFGKGITENSLSDDSDDEQLVDAKTPPDGEWASIGLLPSWERIQVIISNAPYQFMTGLRKELPQDHQPSLTPPPNNNNEVASSRPQQIPSKPGRSNFGPITQNNDSIDTPKIETLNVYDKDGDHYSDAYEEVNNPEPEQEADVELYSDDSLEDKELYDSNEEDWEALERFPTFNQLQDSLRNASDLISSSFNKDSHIFPHIKPTELFSKLAPPSSGISWSSFTHNLPLTFNEEEKVEVDSEEFKALCSEEGLTAFDLEISYNKEGFTGCEHYVRSCKAECNECHKFYPCQLCHNDQELHEMDRTETKRMLCLHCRKPQPPAQNCHFCDELMGDYYCGKCKLWNDDPDKPIYHCDKCGICRVGRGLGIDVFHCDTCGICMSLTIESNHKCIERLANSGCPICLEDLFSSTKAVVFMPCGHPIHSDCFAEYSKRYYRCPLCAKSILNTSALFRMIDEEAKNEVLPPELANLQVDILCQDCRLRSKTQFHLVGLKCETCGSYNTTKF